MRPSCFLLVALLCLSCSEKKPAAEQSEVVAAVQTTTTSLIILGTLQDAGMPHIACKKACCKDLFTNSNPQQQVVSLGLWDASTGKKFLFEATPDISKQVKQLKEFGTVSTSELPNGIFLTHAHIGHYSGLMYLGKEATNANGIAVYSMPRMTKFLTNNGPWSQLVTNQNIILKTLQDATPLALSEELTVTPFLVPHRDEYSETAGYHIKGPNKTALFIPDIDKWSKWETNIVEAIKNVDYAFLDATFFDADEINTRDISEIPHPFVIESMTAFKDISEEEKQKIIFIHFNHTNPLVDSESAAAKKVMNAGFRVAKFNDSFKL